MSIDVIPSKRKKTNGITIKLSPRKRPSKAVLKLLESQRGYLKPNEKLSLFTLKVKNALQRVNNRALKLDSTLTTGECSKLEKVMKTFVKDIDKILKP